MKNGKPTILFLGDDFRMNSGVATMSRELILGTVHAFNWVQIAGAITHPEKGKILDLSAEVARIKGVKDAYVHSYPTDGYGNEQMLFSVIAAEKPDAILHFTDPRFWGWLYALEKQIRSNVPLTYLNIWDDIPYPMYNRPFYESCDALFAISKQTMNINKWVLGEENTCTVNDGPMSGRTLIHYVPHGIDAVNFRPIASNDAELLKFKKQLFKDKDYNFTIFYNSRNVSRKRTSNIILAYRTFCDNLPKEAAKRCVLVLHTEVAQEAGTNLLAVKESMCPDYDIIFSPSKLAPEHMPFLYNIADVTVNASSNEGFGLSVAESILCGTPVTVTVTGGLQDQIGQVDDEGKPVEFNLDFGSNNIGKYKKCGPWAYPVWPVSRMIQGSIPTPYIFDDVTKWEDFAEAFMYWYLMPNEKREACGAKGREWALGEGGINSKNMCDQLITGLNHVFQHWSKPKKYSIHTVKDHIGNKMPGGSHMGFEVPVINKEAIAKQIAELAV